jgi:leucyl-tRNA synthetase
VLHLLYARFWHKVLYDVGVVKHTEPFQKLVHQGMILGMAYRWYAVLDGDGTLKQALDGDEERVEHDREAGEHRLRDTGEQVQPRFVLERDVAWQDGKPVHAEHGVRLLAVAEKMSKSRGNVVNPDEVVREHGADSLRLYEMFMGPLEQVKPWQTSGIQGVRRFLDRVHAVAMCELGDHPPDDETNRLLHRTVKKVGEDIEALRLNTAVSAMMILTNHLAALQQPSREAVQKLLLILSPYAPHLAEELWEKTGGAGSIADEAWPAHDEALCQDEVLEIAVQVNGRVRGRVILSRDASEDDARQVALGDANVQRFTADKTVRRVVYVPGRIINVIVG